MAASIARSLIKHYLRTSMPRFLPMSRFSLSAALLTALLNTALLPQNLALKVVKPLSPSPSR